MDMSSFLTSLATSVVLFAILVLAFACLSSLRPNAVIYRPIHHLHLPFPLPPSPSPSLFRWILDTWSASESHIIHHTGLDAAVYLIFLTSALRIIALTAAFCVPLLLVVAGTDDYYAREKAKNPGFVFSSFDKVSAGNVKEGSGRLWCFVVGAYWMSGVTAWIVWGAYERVVGLRERWYWRGTRAPEQFVVLIRDMFINPPPPPEVNVNYNDNHGHLQLLQLQLDDHTYSAMAHQQLRLFFSLLRPHSYSACLLFPDITRMNELWKMMEKHLCAYKRYEEAFQKRGRRMRRAGGLGAAGFIRRVEEEEGVMEEQAAEIRRLCREMEGEEQEMVRRRQRQREMEGGGDAMVGFAVFKTREAAMALLAVAAMAMTKGVHRDGMQNRSSRSSSSRQWLWTVDAAPDPKQVVWENVCMTRENRNRKTVSAGFIVAATVLVYMVPVGIVSALASSNSLHIKLELVGGTFLRRTVQAYVPQLVLLIFLFLLPPYLLRLSASQGIPSLSRIHRSAANKYFFFIVLNVFLGVSLISTFFSSEESRHYFPASPTAWLSLSLPPQATFFISFVAIKYFVSYGIHLCRVCPLLLYHGKRVLLYHDLPDDDPRVRDAWYPPPLKYAIRIPDDMLIITITLCYAVISPIILPFSMLYFAIGWFVARNEILNVVKPRYESWGKMWPHIHNRILASLFLSQLTILGYFSSKKFPYSTLLIPLPVFTVVFAYACHRRYFLTLDYPPLLLSEDQHIIDIGNADSRSTSISPPSVDSILAAYTPPCLQWRQHVNATLKDMVLAVPEEHLHAIVREGNA